METSLVATLSRNDGRLQNLFAGEADDYVALLEARLFGRAARQNITDQDALGALVQPKLPGRARG